ncbi:hypothetical protein [Ruegeria sp. HKCCE4148]|uniref:hypothetical protein n=1 Tax=Ruegeria sp. HKCCE4148 TaxID=2794829 RepID=UPI001AE88B13|nr:hypothetical protein [Ruegeria sp. HKCCE4148]
MAIIRPAGTTIRPHQRAITGVFPHNGNRRFIIPNRRASAPVAFTVQSIKGVTDEGGGQYRLTGPGAQIGFKLDDPKGGRYRLYVDVVNTFVDGILTDKPKGTALLDSSFEIEDGPVPDGYQRSSGGMISSQNGELWAISKYIDVPAGYEGKDPLFLITSGSNEAADSYETYANIRLERMVG